MIYPSFAFIVNIMNQKQFKMCHSKSVCFHIYSE